MPFSSTGPSASVQPSQPEAHLQLLPDALVRPLGDVLVGPALDVEAAELGRAQAEQREAALVMGVDQLVVRRRDRGEDAEPAERVLARERPQDARRDARPADAVEAVAAGDDVALELVLPALVREQDTRPLRLEVLDADVVHLEEQRAPGLEPRRDQILDDLGLAVDVDRLAAGELAHVDPVALAVELQLDARVDEALAAQALPDACVGEEVDDALLEHAGADARLDVLAAAVLEDHRLDPVEVEQLREHQAGRAGADDRDLRAHHAPLPLEQRRLALADADAHRREPVAAAAAAQLVEQA